MAKPPARLTDPDDIARFMRAAEDYFEKGTTSVKCDQCGQTIEFWQVTPTVWQHKCACGKYNGDLRGL